MTVLVIAEHDNQNLKPSNLNLLTAASQLSSEITLLIAGADCQKVAEQACILPGVKHVLVLNNPCYQHQLAENLAKAIKEIAEGYAYILAAANSFGKNLLPRVAALMDLEQISDVIEIIDKKTFKRPIYAGNALATVQTAQEQNIISIRTTHFAPIKGRQEAIELEFLDKFIDNSQSQFVQQQVNDSARPDLTQARVIVSGGRGLQSADKFELIEQLADLLNAAIGATRAVVDAGFVPNDYQVGQTGKIVAPELYIAVGISGAIQHIAGMKDSKVIVAINKDPDAAIFKVADYGIVGDLFSIVPELITELKQS